MENLVIDIKSKFKTCVENYMSLDFDNYLSDFEGQDGYTFRDNAYDEQWYYDKDSILNDFLAVLEESYPDLIDQEISSFDELLEYFKLDEEHSDGIFRDIYNKDISDQFSVWLEKTIEDFKKENFEIIKHWDHNTNEYLYEINKVLPKNYIEVAKFSNFGVNCLDRNDFNYKEGSIEFDSENEEYYISFDSYEPNLVHSCSSRNIRVYTISDFCEKYDLSKFDIEYSDESHKEKTESYF